MDRGIKTVKIKANNPRGFLIINQDDFDLGEYTLWAKTEYKPTVPSQREYRQEYAVRKYMVDVIVPVMDRQEETLMTLDALFINNDNIRVIIIDNGSKDLSYLKKYKGLIKKVIKNKSNYGAIKAINQGLKISKSKYVVVMHNDIVVRQFNWIDKAINFLDQDSTIGMVGLAGWKILHSDGVYDSIITGLDEYNDRKGVRQGEVAVLDGCCNVIRNIGLQLDVRYGLFHFYDMDLSMQYREKGYGLYVMDAQAVHLAEDRSRSTVKNRKYTRKIKVENSEYWESRQAIFVEKWEDQLPNTIAPFMTFIFRCTNRPQGIKRALRALRKQTDYDYQILCLVDDQVRGLAFANESLAVAKHLVKGKYVYIYEDDDEFIHHDFIKELKERVKDSDPDVIMVKSKIGEVTYPTEGWEQRPILGKIGMPCFCVSNVVYQKHAEEFNTDDCADYHFLKDVFDYPYKIDWWDKMINHAYSYHRTKIENEPINFRSILKKFDIPTMDIIYGHDVE